MRFKPNLKNTVLLVLACVFTGCAAPKKYNDTRNSKTSTSGTPRWVQNPNADYPDGKYLVFVGSGSAQGSAQREAKAGLAEIFKTKIQASSTYNKTVKESDSQFSQFMELNSQINTSTDLEIANIKLPQTYYDKKKDQYFALATLDKFETSTLYKKKTDDLVEANTTLYNRFKSEYDDVKQLSLIGGMHYNAQKIDNYVEILRVVGSGYMKTNTLTKAEVEKERDKLLDKVPVHCTFAANEDAVILDAVKKEFTKIGFKLVNSANESKLQALINLTTKETTLQNNPAKFMNWDLSIKLENRNNSRTLFVYSTKGRSSQLTLDALEERCRMDIGKKLKKEFPKYLYKHLFKHQ